MTLAFGRYRRIFVIGVLTAGVLCRASLGFSQMARDPQPLPPSKEFDVNDLGMPLNPTSEAQIDQLIAALGSPVFAERESATAQLVFLGAPAFPRLRDAYQATDDFEVRSRIEAVVQIAFMDHHVYSNFGFLGIGPGNFPGPDEFPQIQPGHSGITVERITDGSGAANAGLTHADVIIALDGRPIPGAGRRAFENFSTWIRERRPGGRVELTVLRDGGELTIEATLTRPPPDRTAAGGVGVEKLPERVNAAKAKFSIWWMNYFKNNKTQECGRP